MTDWNYTTLRHCSCAQCTTQFNWPLKLSSDCLGFFSIADIKYPIIKYQGIDKEDPSLNS